MVARLAIIDRIVARIDLTRAGLLRHVFAHAKLNSRQNQEQNMRVTLLAAAMLCFMGLAASAQPMTPDSSGLGAITGAMRYVDSPWLSHAMHDVGTNPTGWKRQWCAKSMNMWLQRSGMRGCGGNSAISCLQAGRKLSGPQVGALAVMAHHVGIVKEVGANSVTLVSGNHNRTVGVGKYPRGRVVAYVWPE
jgi:uncharacterized protein (TIGR02594 family)